MNQKININVIHLFLNVNRLISAVFPLGSFSFRIALHLAFSSVIF